MNPTEALFLEWKQSRGLGVHVREATRKPRGRGRAHPLGTPSTLMGPSLLHRPTSSSYISPRTPNIQEQHENLIPPPQPSIPERSHLGAFSRAPPEGASITESFYINTIASPMMCEQFTSYLRVHSYQLDGFFSLFGSQYKFLLDSLRDLFDVIFFCGVFVETDELWVYDQVYL